MLRSTVTEASKNTYRALDQLHADPDDRQEAWVRLRRRHGWDGNLPAPPRMILARRRKDRNRAESRRRAREVEHAAHRAAAAPPSDPCFIISGIEEAKLIFGIAKRATGNTALTYAQKHFLDAMSYDAIAGVFQTQARRVREMVNLVEDVVRIVAAVVRDPIKAGDLPDRLYPTPKRRIAAARAALTRAGAITDVDGVLGFSTGASLKHERRDRHAASTGRTSTADMRCIPPRCPKCGVASNSKVCPVRTAPCGLEEFFNKGNR